MIQFTCVFMINGDDNQSHSRVMRGWIYTTGCQDRSTFLSANAQLQYISIDCITFHKCVLFVWFLPAQYSQADYQIAKSKFMHSVSFMNFISILIFNLNFQTIRICKYVPFTNFKNCFLHDWSIVSLEPKMFKLVPHSHLAQSFVSTFLCSLKLG